MAVRRLLDPREDVISLVRLLKDILTMPTAISRGWFVSQYDGLPWADRDFDQFAPNGAPYLDPTIVQGDLNQLLATRRQVGDWINKLIAHRDEKIALGKTANLPTLTWAELDAAVDLLGETLKRYELLLNQRGLVGTEPVVQEPLEWVFGVPWLNPEAGKARPE